MKTNGNGPVEHVHEIAPFAEYMPLTKREYFAILAYQAMITGFYSSDKTDCNDVSANDAIEYADSLIDTLNKAEASDD